MNNLFDSFKQLWPESRHASLKPLLSEIGFIRLPLDERLIRERFQPEKTVVLIDEAKLIDLTVLASLGYEHVVQTTRTDFAQELLVSALMISKPKSFVMNPMPFLFSGTMPSLSSTALERQITIPIRTSGEKLATLDRLSQFFQQTPRLRGISDLCLQTADELLTNALYGAPTDHSGEHLFAKRPRTSAISLPPGANVTLFAHFNDERLIVGTQDPFGSLNKAHVLNRLKVVYSTPKSSPLYSVLGAGLGFKYMIDNSANFYVFSSPKKTTLVAAGFLLNGLRANLNARKHFHFTAS